MDPNSYKTLSLRAADCQRQWLIVDAREKILGRLAARIAHHLRGKHKANYSPHMDCGDAVVVINAEAIRLTGNKWDKKVYIRHTGYPGGQRRIHARHLHEKHPARILETAIRGMLPKNKLGRKQFRNCYVYAGDKHPHEAQNPQPLGETSASLARV